MVSKLPSSTTPTIYDVAAKAGVSIATVSRVLNDSSGTSEFTRERVLQAIQSLQFVPNGAARSLSIRTEHVLGLVFYKPPGYAEAPLSEDEEEGLLYTDAVIRGAEHACQEHGYSLLLSGAGGPRAPETILSLSAHADGLLLLERVLPESRVGRLARRVPIVLLAGSGRSRSVSTVHVDNRASIAALARHLIVDHGYNELAFVGEVPGSPDAQARSRSLSAEAQALGASCESGPQWQGDFTAAGGRRVIKRQLSERGSLPRALVCASDQTALGVLEALREADLRVPEDVAVTGFDGIPVTRHLDPPLTTIRQPMRDLGAVGVKVLLEKIESPAVRMDPLTLPTTLLIRESCGPHPASPPVHPDGPDPATTPHPIVKRGGSWATLPDALPSM